MPQTDRSGDRVVPARPIDPPSPRREDERVRGREDWQGGHLEPEREGHPAPESTGRPTPESAGRREPEGAAHRESQGEVRHGSERGMRHEYKDEVGPGDEGRHVPEGADRSRHEGAARSMPAGANASARDGAALEREQVPTQAMAAPQRRGVFSAEEAESLRGRWHRVQGSFVDDPGASVEEADKLVVDALKVLAEHKRALEGWRRRGAQTEDLRQALQGYRMFLDRLLEV